MKTSSGSNIQAMKSLCRKIWLLVAIVLFYPRVLAANFEEYGDGDDFLIDPGKRPCDFNEIEAKVYGGLLIDSNEVSNMSSYTIKEFHVTEIQCVVGAYPLTTVDVKSASLVPCGTYGVYVTSMRLQATELVFRWITDCPSGEMVQSHFVLSRPWVNKTTTYRKSICNVYEQSSKMIQMVNRSWNQCNVTCNIGVKDRLDKLMRKNEPNITYSILLKIIRHDAQQHLHLIHVLGCAYYFRFIEILFTVGAVSLIVCYAVWFKLCYKCRKVDVPVVTTQRKGTIVAPFSPGPEHIF